MWEFLCQFRGGCSDNLNMTQYTAAIVGTGRIGFTLGFDRKREQPAAHTGALQANRRIRLITGADTDGERRARWQQHVRGARAFATSDELYAACTPDIVTVAVNEDAHKAECIKAIRAKPRLVILEKPVALTSAQAQDIADCAREHAVPVMVNHERRFARDWRAAKEYMHRIGDLQMLRADLFSGLRIYSAAHEADGAYSLLHDGTHLIDIVQFLLEDFCDPPHDRSEPLLPAPAVSGIYRDEKGDVRNFTARYALPACPEVTVTMSGRSRFFAFAVDILGTTGRICIGNGFAKFYSAQESRLYTGFRSLAPDPSVRLPKKTGYFANMIQNAVDFLDGTAPLLSPLATAIADLKALEAIKARIAAR